MNNYYEKHTGQGAIISNEGVHTLNFKDSVRNFGSNASDKISQSEVTELYKSINTIINRLNELEKENTILRNDLSDTRTRENKLLNRFSGLILIINWASVILIIIAVVLFINSFYPFIKEIMKNDIGIRVVITTVGSIIAGGIVAAWLKFNKYVNKVIEREKN